MSTEIEVVAYHEAGHALIAVLSGGRVQSVTIEPDDDDGPARTGDTQVRWSRRLSEREFALKAAKVALAGPVAEMLYSGEPLHPGLVPEWAHDWQAAWSAMAVVEPGERPRLQLLERCIGELYRLLDSEPHWSALADVADHLLAHETLEGDDIREIISPWLS